MSTEHRTSRRVAYEREDRGVEQRQLFAIFFAAVVVAMVVFLLGVLAGKGHGPASVVPAPSAAPAHPARGGGGTAPGRPPPRTSRRRARPRSTPLPRSRQNLFRRKRPARSR